MSLHNRLALVDALPHGARVIELGVAKGAFACAMLRRRPDLNYLGIDRWAGDRGHDDQEYQMARREIELHGGQVERASFEDAVRRQFANSADLVYVDGYAHTGQQNGKILDDWWSIVKTGGLFAGHDYDLKVWPHTYKAVRYFAGDRGLTVEDIPDLPYASWKIRKPFINPTTIGNALLIGNGPSLIGRGLGQRIDSFEHVTRFNGFKIAGHEADYGTRLDQWASYGKTAMEERPERADEMLYLHGAIGDPFYTPVRQWRVRKAFYDQVRSELQDVSQVDEKRKAILLPSAGFLTALWMLKMERADRITLAAFDHFNRKTSRQHHYWQPGSFLVPQEHDGLAEQLLLQQFGNRIERL